MGGSSSSRVTVGYRYFMGLHMGICHGPVDSLSQINVGDRVAWNAGVTESGRITIDAPGLFGGETKEGGIRGDADVMMGEPTQGANDYLASRQGGLQPAYRGMLGIVYRGGLISAMNPYVKPWAFRVTRLTKGWDQTVWNPGSLSVSMGSGLQAMNPAHIVYECITNRTWGMGYSASTIDDDSFTAAAAKLAAEGFGLCLKWTRQESIEQFIQRIMDHIGGVFAQDKRSGLFRLTLIRDDYDPETLPVFDERNIISLEQYERASIVDTVNELTVKYDDAVTGRTGSVTVQNLANITAQGGVVAESRDYPGLPTAGLAIRVAMRDLKSVSSPVAKVRFKADRSAWELLPGDVIRFAWSKAGITNMILRVVRVNHGTLTSGAMEIEAVEDIYGLPAAGYAKQEPVGWVDPTSDPSPATNRIIMEAPRWALLQDMTPEALAAMPEDAGILYTVAVRPTGDATNYDIATAPVGGNYTQEGVGDFCPSGVTVAAIGPSATSVQLADLIDYELIEAGEWAILGSEIVRVDSFDRLTSTVTIGRGVLDTVATSHPAGTRMYFAQEYFGTDQVERLSGEELRVKLLPTTGRGTLAEPSAPEDLLVFDSRMARPYPPGRLRVNGEAEPEQIIDEPVTVAWAHRDRTQQNLEGDESGSIGPEEGTTYTVVYSDADTDEVLEAVTGITGTSHTMSELRRALNLRVQVWSVRDDLESQQAQERTFWYSNLYTRVTEDGDERVTENGDTRIVE